MAEANQERWKELCAQAAVEKKTDKLLKLVQEINRLMSEKAEPKPAIKDSASNVTHTD